MSSSTKRVKFYEWRPSPRDGDYYTGWIRVWNGPRSPLEWSGKPATVEMRFQANALTWDSETGAWGRVDCVTREWEQRQVSHLYNVLDEDKDHRSGCWYAGRFYDVRVHLETADATSQLAAWHRRLVAAIDRYNCTYRYRGDEAAVIIAALDALKYGVVRRHNHDYYESRSPLAGW